MSQGKGTHSSFMASTAVVAERSILSVSDMMAVEDEGEQQRETRGVYENGRIDRGAGRDAGSRDNKIEAVDEVDGKEMRGRKRARQKRGCNMRYKNEYLMLDLVCELYVKKHPRCDISSCKCRRRAHGVSWQLQLFSLVMLTERAQYFYTVYIKALCVYCAGSPCGA